MKLLLLLVCTALISNVACAVENLSDEKPERISCPEPVMPAKAQALRIEGTVDYAAYVNEKGDVDSVNTTGDEIFFRETQTAFKKCNFKPGHPGVERGTIKFSFFTKN